MSPDPISTSNPTSTKLCPTCGTRVANDAARCLVCGTDLTAVEKTASAAKAVQGSRMPEITLSLPAALGLLALFLAIGAIMVFFAIQKKPEVIIPFTPTSTETITVTPSLTPTQPPPTATYTPLPTPTPITYKVVQNDSCLKIAGTFGISMAALIQVNNLGTDCVLSVGQSLLIPQPTPTATPLPTATLSSAQLTEAACQKVDYTVADNDTPSGIAAKYNVPWQIIKDENGLTGDIVFSGQTLSIPLCKRPTPLGPTATPTLPPPYPAPNLLLPADGAPFTLADDTVTLQWASVGTLRSNEAYAVTVVDVTDTTVPKFIKYVTDTKLIIPANYRPQDKMPHVFRWWVITVRQTGTDSDGNPTYDAAGAQSVQRDFTWSGAPAGAQPTP
jgi:LysM repeat protein